MILGFDICEISTSKNVYATLKNSDKEMHKNKSEIRNTAKDIKIISSSHLSKNL
jgi:hypothetical protein